MANCCYIKYDLFKPVLELVNKLKSPRTGFNRQHEIRIFVSMNQNVMLLQTHIASEPAAVCCSLAIHSELDCDIDITVAAKALLNCVSALDQPAFFKLSLDDSGLLVQGAMFGGGLFGTDNYAAIETTSRHHVLFQPTQLIADYKTVVADQQPQFRLRDKQLQTLKQSVALAKSSKKQKSVQFKIENEASAMFVDLFASDVCAHLEFMEHDAESDFKIYLSLLDFVFLKEAVAVFIKWRLGAVGLTISDQSTLVLSCQNMLCELTQHSDVVPREERELTDAKKGWCADSNQRLQDGLAAIVVKTSRAEDIAEIQVQDGQINFLQLTEYASGSFGNEAKTENGTRDGPAVVVNRYQLYPALKCFNLFEKLKIHGLLSREDGLLIRPSNNNNEFVMLAITEPVNEEGKE